MNLGNRNVRTSIFRFIVGSTGRWSHILRYRPPFWFISNYLSFGGLFNLLRIHPVIASHRLTIDLWLAKDNRFLNPKSSYGRILTAPPCRLISCDWLRADNDADRPTFHRMKCFSRD